MHAVPPFAARYARQLPQVVSDLLTTTALPASLTLSRAGNAMLFDSSGKLTYAPNNALTYSEAFDNAAWSRANVLAFGSGSIANSTATLDPAGGNTSDFIVPNTTPGVHYLAYRNVTVPTSVFSVYVKPGGYDYVTLYFYDSARTGSVDGATFYLSGAGSFSNYQNNSRQVSYSISAAANGFYRVSIFTSLAITQVGICASNTASNTSGSDNLPTFTGDGVKGLYLWGAQLEAVTYQTTPSTYVATTSAAYYGPRFDYDPSTLTANGLLDEAAATNVALWCRDLTNAAWSKTNVTAAKDQAGIDGVSNSASKITASAGNGTCLQSITLASSQRRQSAFVKRITGTGTIEMTTDGGSTWTAVTVTNDWARVSIPAQTVTNPSVGFRIVTSGDAIAVDFVQNETGADVTSPIFTSSASVTRAAETSSAAQYGTQPAIVQYRLLSDNSRARKIISPYSGISSENGIAIEKIAIYAPSTPTALLNQFLNVNGQL